MQKIKKNKNKNRVITQWVLGQEAQGRGVGFKDGRVPRKEETISPLCYLPAACPGAN